MGTPASCGRPAGRAAGWREEPLLWPSPSPERPPGWLHLPGLCPTTPVGRERTRLLGFEGPRDPWADAPRILQGGARLQLLPTCPALPLVILGAQITPLPKGRRAHLTCQVRGPCLGWGHLLGSYLSRGSEPMLLEPPRFSLLPEAPRFGGLFEARLSQHPARHRRPLPDAPSESTGASHGGRAAPGSGLPPPALAGRSCPAFPPSQAPCWPWRTCGHFL